MELFSIILFLLCNLVFIHSNGEDDKILPYAEDYDQNGISILYKFDLSVYFLEDFNDKLLFEDTWNLNRAKILTYHGVSLSHEDDWVLEQALRFPLPNDLGLTFHKKNKHRALAAPLFSDFNFTDNTAFILQYEIMYQVAEECGGAYLKLFEKRISLYDLSVFNPKTPYKLMMGHDMCNFTNTVRFIFCDTKPLNGSYEEKSCVKKKTIINETFADMKPHLIRLNIEPDDSYTIFMDYEVIDEGYLVEASEIPDPYDFKPTHWYENELINISDLNAVKPDDRTEEMDDKCTSPPLVPTPSREETPSCGPTSAPVINCLNTEKQTWGPPLTDSTYTNLPMDGIVIEIRSESGFVLLDNILITDDDQVADNFALKTFKMKMHFILYAEDTTYYKLLAYTKLNPWMWIILWLVPLVAITIITGIHLWSKRDPEAKRKIKEEMQRIEERLIYLTPSEIDDD